MKKILLIAAAALTSFSLSAQQFKFAHVNYAELVQLVPEADQARDKIAAATKEAQDTYQSMMEEFQAKYQQYQAKASSWTPAVRESKEKELSDIDARVKEFQQSIQVELQQQESALMAPIQKKVKETVEKLAKEGGYIYVFEKNSLMYINESMSVDLTPAARKLLGIKEGRTLESLQAEIMAKQNASPEAAKKQDSSKKTK